MGGQSGGQQIQPGGILGGMAGNAAQAWQNSPQWQRMQSAFQSNSQLAQMMSIFGGGGVQGPGTQMLGGMTTPNGYNGGAQPGGGGQMGPLPMTPPPGGVQGPGAQMDGTPIQAGGGAQGPGMQMNQGINAAPPWQRMWGRNPGAWGQR